jgi:sugar/nucleoside kinase (ribokinase family)
LCVGAANWDIIGRTGTQLALGGDVAGRVERCPGGVALNIALGLARHGVSVSLCSAVGEDAEGHALIRHLEACTVDCTNILKVQGGATGHYIAIEDERGDLFGAIADTALLEEHSEAIALQTESALQSSRMVVVETNLTISGLTKIARASAAVGVEIVLNPVSPAKATRLAFLLSGQFAPTIVANLAEVVVLLQQPFDTTLEAAQALQVATFGTALVTDGPRPAALATPTEAVTLTPPEVQGELSVTGAGDALLSAFLVSRGHEIAPSENLRFALQAAADHLRIGKKA